MHLQAGATQLLGLPILGDRGQRIAAQPLAIGTNDVDIGGTAKIVTMGASAIGAGFLLPAAVDFHRKSGAVDLGHRLLKTAIELRGERQSARSFLIRVANQTSIR